ncbi:hypothetical protein [Microbacterium enclense]|uniref:Uncharacterized protein n=1 Tax=Microbacterium enclense TaxID=993073 RepID=A0A1G6IB71_9MICO|nr:hypothetical protein [Microbacterium enclense]KSU55001.1 hypothetical protein AS029_06005 [Microbacterium enclense]SDC03754.1 hypothetical protein SAMN05216418_1457 [Microbacterium enclense]
MTELDLGQKVAARRLLWRMGFSTRVDVVLRAAEHAHPGQGKGSPEAYTDLDVLGVAVTPSGHVQTAIVDCKTGKASVISRMFWVRGVKEFFDADAAYMVRDRAISPDANQLAARLGISAFTERDVEGLERLLPTVLPVDTAPLSGLFLEQTVARSMGRFAAMDRRLGPILDYRQFGYWVQPEHRSLVVMPDTLLALKDVLQSGNPNHVGLIIDCAWLYTLSLARAIANLRATHISDLSYGLSEYLLGGATQLKQQKDMADLLRDLQAAGEVPAKATISVDPRFFGPLLELVTRLMRRGTLLTDALRILEFQSASAMLGERQPASEAFRGVFDKTAAKLAADVADFLVTAADLNPKFAAVIREVLTYSSVPEASPQDGKSS